MFVPRSVAVVRRDVLLERCVGRYSTNAAAITSSVDSINDCSWVVSFLFKSNYLSVTMLLPLGARPAQLTIRFSSCAAFKIDSPD